MITYLTVAEISDLWIQLQSGKLQDAEIQTQEEYRAAQRVCELLIEKAGTYGKDRPHPVASEMAKKAGERTSRVKREAAKRNGFSRGEANAQAVLTAAKVREIRKLASLGKQHKDIAPKFGVTPQTVTNIVNRVSWRYL